MIASWVKAANNGKVSSVVLLDLSAAFDLMSLEILLEKLRIYGIDKDCLKWKMNYLTDRKHTSNHGKFVRWLKNICLQMSGIKIMKF